MASGKTNGFIIKTIQLIGAAFIAKGLGFVREMVLANYYGTSYISDVFVAVQNIPAVVFTVFGTAVTTGFIPLYTELSVKNGKKVADKFANNVFNIFLILSIGLTVIGILFSEQLVSIFAGGFSGKTFNLCNQFAKIVMPTSVAIILVYVYNAYLQIEGLFNQNSLMNVPYNIIQIVFIILGFYLGNAYVLSVGLLLASFSQLIYLRILVKKKTAFKHSWQVDFSSPQIKKMLILVGPVFISTGVNQLNSIVDRAMASRLVEGSISALNYSSEVANIVTQVVILSLTTILYPKMTEVFAKNNENKKNAFIETYLNVVSILVLPFSALIFFFSEEIVQILFGRGAFDAKTVIFVSRALKIYALGIVGASLRDVLNRVFYSMKNTVIPMVNGIVAVVVNISLNFLLIEKYKYLGLAFATAFSGTICTLLLFVQMCRKTKELDVKGIIFEFVKTTIAVLSMLTVLSIFKEKISVESSFWKCIIGGSVGLVIYFITLILFQQKNMKHIISLAWEWLTCVRNERGRK